VRSAIKRLAPVLVTGTLLWAGDAWALVASQPTAKEKPNASGPLSFEGRRCEQKKEIFTNPKTGDSETVAVAEACVLLYAYDPAAEDDLEHDYGITWLQTTVDARNGWCAIKVRSDLTITDDAKLFQHDPKKAFERRRPRRIRVKVSTDAQGHGSDVGRLQQSFTMRPRRLRPFLIKRASANLFRLRWTGRTERKLAFVSGVEIAWDADDAVNAMTSGLSYEFEKRGNCR
jgi:hypothetical protein